MKEKLLEIVDHLRDDEIDLEETPVIFEWIYEEEPHIKFKLLITELDESGIEAAPVVH
jgi:hypothetical protein